MNIREITQGEAEQIKMLIIKFAMQNNLNYDIGINSITLMIPNYKEVKDE